MTLGRARKWPLRLVLVAGFVLVAVLSVTALALQRYHSLTTQLLRDDLASDLALARAVAAGLDVHLAPKIHLIGARARDFGASGLDDRTALARELDAIRRRNPSFATLLIADTSGVAIAFSPRVDGAGRPNVGRRYGDRKWFRDVLRPPHTPSYDVVIGRALARPTVGVAAPITARSGEVIGVLAAGLDLDEVHRLAELVSPGEKDRLVVVDAEGRVVAHSSPEWVQQARDLSGEAVFQAAQRRAAGSVEYLSTFTGETRWGSFVRVPATGWLVWATRGPEHLAPKVRGFVVDLAWASGVALLIAAGAAVVLTRFISRPLSALAEATGQLSGRRFRTEGLLPRRGSAVKEVDQLLAGFGEMADTLRVQYEDLEAKVAERTEALERSARAAQEAAARLRAREAIERGYGELAALLNSLDRSYVLQEGARKIADTLRAPLVAVYLTDDGPSSLRLKTYAAHDPALLDTRLLSAAGLPGEVARRGVAVVLAQAASPEPLRLHTGLGTVDVAAVAGYPLRHQDLLLGVLVVALLAPPDAHTAGFLENASRQLSVALSNAGLFESIRHQSQQLERLNGELQRASEVKSQFLASMSHELRTPLNSIIGFTEVLLMSVRDPLSERQRGALEKVLGSGRHLLALINDVLDLSKIEAGRVELRAERFGLGALIGECLETVEPQAAAKGLALRRAGLEAAAEIDQDRGKVKQILLNLLSNAIKFTEQGSVTVRVEPAYEKLVTVAVADTGIGIRPEDQEIVFEAFRQVNQADGGAPAGTGLGLAVSRRLARLMGGELSVASVPGRGSVFTLRLPVSLETPPVSWGADTAELPPGPARILVIDDDRNVAEIVREVMAGEPVGVEWAAGAREGLARARAAAPALILLDIILNGADDGWEVLAALKRDPATRAVPVIVHSVIDNPKRAEDLGAAAVLAKPLAAETVRATIRRYLDLGPREPEARA